MHLKNKKKFIISLIMDDLIHTKLLEGLGALHLKPELYCIDAGDKAIMLMGFTGKENEGVYEYYLGRRKQSKNIDISEGNTGIKKLARTIYNELLLQKKQPDVRPQHTRDHRRYIFYRPQYIFYHPQNSCNCLRYIFSQPQYPVHWLMAPSNDLQDPLSHPKYTAGHCRHHAGALRSTGNGPGSTTGNARSHATVQEVHLNTRSVPAVACGTLWNIPGV